MYHATKPPLRTIIIIPDSALRRTFVADISGDPRFRLLGNFASLNAAYTQTEARSPDLTICSKDLALQSEFPMFDAMLNMVGCTLLTIHPGAGSATVARALDLVRVDQVPIPAPAIIPNRVPHRLVAIGASTGGIEALTQILSQYPSNCPPTVIVQHIKPEFLSGVVDRLDRACLAKVVAGSSQLKLRPGQVVVAPGMPSHLEVQAQTMRCTLVDSPHVSGHRPSVDVLFNSVADLNTRAVGVLLTGMGRDGATGLAAMRRAGAWTIAQDANTSVVHGMPRVAAQEGAVCAVLPLSKICGAIIEAASEPQGVAP